MREQIIPNFFKGAWNLNDDEIIPQDAAQDMKNWYYQDGFLKLLPGRAPVGSVGTTGISIPHWGIKNDGTKILFRKIDTKIQYWNGSAYQDIITGLTTANGTFNNYQSLAGSFVIFTSRDGIYKVHTANLGSHIQLQGPSDSFRGYSIIDKGRMLLWDKPNDKTGLYFSHTDVQTVGTNYTTISGEVLGASGTDNYTGTLAFKAGGAKRNSFALTITGTTGSGVETFTDNYDGTLTGSLGGTGTINYVTGDYDITFSENVTSGNVEANYTYEDSTSNGIADFTYSSTRLASEGFVLRQDEGGDAIITVTVGQDGAYYSLKENSAYRVELEATDLLPLNEIYRKDIGIKSVRGAISTSKGIVFMNLSNPDRPELTILQENPLGDNIQPAILTPHFKYSNYLYDSACFETHNKYVVIGCKTLDSSFNDTILLVDTTEGTVAICGYESNGFTKTDGSLYTGSQISQTVYKLFDGFDDSGYSIDNFWTSRGDTFDSEMLKKNRFLKLKGKIDKTQIVEVYSDYDDSGFQLVGTIRGDGTYVDLSSGSTIGYNLLGELPLGGGVGTTIYPYFVQFKIKTPKYRKRTIRLKAIGFGYFHLDSLYDSDIILFEHRIPSRNRQKQNVSLDGTQSNLSTPQF